MALDHGGPRWVARLDNGLSVVGRPSWLGSSEAAPMSDWLRLKERCLHENQRICSLGLWVPALGWFHAPGNCGAYGYWEQHVTKLQMGRPQPRNQAGCEAVCIAWLDEKPGGLLIRAMKIFASGAYEEWDRHQWLPCMIGPPEAQQRFKDEGVLTRKAWND